MGRRNNITIEHVYPGGANTTAKINEIINAANALTSPVFGHTQASVFPAEWGHYTHAGIFATRVSGQKYRIYGYSIASLESVLYPPFTSIVWTLYENVSPVIMIAQGVVPAGEPAVITHVYETPYVSSVVGGSVAISELEYFPETHSFMEAQGEAHLAITIWGDSLGGT